MTLLALYIAMGSLMSLQEILDSRFYYSATEASNFFAALGSQKTHIYLKHQLLDLLFLSSYSVIAFSIVEILFPKSSKMKIFSVVPGIFDLIETVSIIAILLGAPTFIFVGWLGLATCLKWLTGCLLTILIVFRLVAVLKAKLTASV